MKINKQTREMLLFMAFGDGCITKSGYFSMRHCLAQKEYLQWKDKLLNKNGIKTTGLYFVSNNNYGAYETRTYTHKFIKLYRKVLYTPNKKYSKIKILNKLNSLGLAIWYLDDGGISKRVLKSGEKSIKELMLNTHLTKEENQVIIDYFFEKWGIKFSQCKNKGRYRLRCGKVQAEKFIKIIEKHVREIPCMIYKIDPNHVM